MESYIGFNSPLECTAIFYTRMEQLDINIVPVTANRAPNALTSVRTNVIPKYPVIENMNANPYA